MKVRRAGLTGVLVLLPSAASAHAFGQRYDLPIPLKFFLVGAAAVLIYTFASLAITVKKPAARTVKAYAVATVPRWLSTSAITVATFLLVLTYVTGTIGTVNAANNFISTFFWVTVWIGLPLSFILFGNYWTHINPVVVLARKIEPHLQTLRYPAWLGVYPALGAFAVFIWMELAYFDGYFPRHTAVALTAYFAFLAAGIILYGATWVRNAEFFTVLSRIIGSLSPLTWDKGRLCVRPPISGLLALDTRVYGLIPFTLFFIAGVTYDGFRETTVWRQIFTSDTFPFSQTILGTLEIIAVFLILLAAYYLIIAAVKAVSRTNESINDLARRFVVSLIPVAVAYTVAHYFSYFVTTGQDVIRLASDPFGFGWNLFGTSGFTPNINLIPLKYVWYFQVVVVLLGHAAGLYVAHKVALQTFTTAQAALRSQYPMLILMIALTSLALWILHAPLAP